MSLGKKISELPVATTLTGLELAVVVQTSTTKQSTPEAITASVSSRLDNVVSVNNAALTSINNTVSALEIRVSAVSARASVNAAAITSINAEVSLKVYRTGDYMTNARYIEFDTSVSTSPTTGKLAWNSNDGTLDVGLLGTTVLQIGQETLFYVKNTDTTTIADGRLVMATGVVGNSGKIEAQRANGSGAISAEYFLGIATQDIPVGEFGYVTHFGLVRGINATGSQYGQTWAEADLLYANTSIAGGLTNVPPPYPGFSTPLAIVVNAVSNAGSIFVRMKSGEYLEQLHDVDISAKASGDIIVWSSTLGAWTNSQAFVQAEASISALNIQVAAVSAFTSVNAAAITSVNNVVSALEVRVSNVSAINTTQTAAITSINNVVSALEIRVSSVSAAVVSVNNVVSALSSAVAAVGVTAINAALTSINNTVSALEVRVSAVSAVNTTQIAAITSVNNVVSVLEIRVSNASTINTTQTAAITSINNVVSALEIRVSNASTTNTTLAAAITSVNAVVSLKVNRSGDTMTGNLTVPSLNSGSLAGFRNALINGAFNIAQRGTSFAAGANNDDTYNLDRWYVLSDGNDVVDITQSTTEVPANGSQTSIALDVETTTKKFGIAQIIEQRNCQGLIGNTVTLSFKAKASSTTKLDNVKCAIVAWSGTADTVTSDIVSAWNVEGTDPTLIANATYENTPSNLNVTTSWATYSVSAAVDTASTKNIIVFIWSDVTDTTAGDFLYITDVQVEIGSVATPFERRSIDTELALCQRYYEKSYDQNIVPGTNSYLGTSYGIRANGGWTNQGIYKVTKRAIPTVTTYSPPNGTAARIRNEGIGGDEVSTVDSNGVTSFRAYGTSLTNGVLFSMQWTADAEL